MHQPTNTHKTTQRPINYRALSISRILQHHTIKKESSAAKHALWNLMHKARNGQKKTWHIITISPTKVVPATKILQCHLYENRAAKAQDLTSTSNNSKTHEILLYITSSPSTPPPNWTLTIARVHVTSSHSLIYVFAWCNACWWYEWEKFHTNPSISLILQENCASETKKHEAS
jgi:hypothetical protein